MRCKSGKCKAHKAGPDASKIKESEVRVMEFCPDCGAQLIHADGCVMCACCGWSKCDCSVCNGKGEMDVQPEDRVTTGKKVVSAQDELCQLGNKQAYDRDGKRSPE